MHGLSLNTRDGVVLAAPTHQKRGLAAFTLLELLAAMAILSVLVLMLTAAFRSSSDLMTRNNAKVEFNQTIRAVMLQITRDLERSLNLPNKACMHQPNPAPLLIPGAGIYTNTLFFLADLPPAEPNPLGTIVNVGYGIHKTNLAGVAKWVLMRGDDSFVDVNTFPSNWWQNLTVPDVEYWKVLSENVIGIRFDFFNNTATVDDFIGTWSSMTSLPYSVGVTIWAIDSVSYDRALTVDPNLASPPSQTILRNNVHEYYTRVFVPLSTQN